MEYRSVHPRTAGFSQAGRSPVPRSVVSRAVRGVEMM